MNTDHDTRGHAPFAELLALRLYGELDPPEHAELDAHLATCADCTRLERELASGLGVLATRARAHAPIDLSARIERALAHERVAERSAARWRTWLPAAASFAAGVLATWLVVRGAPAEVGTRVNAPAHGTELAATTWDRFHADAPPPRGGSSGALARWTAYARR